MDKKTKKSGAKAKPQTKGFGTAMGVPSSGFPYAGTVTPGVQSPQRVVEIGGIVKQSDNGFDLDDAFGGAVGERGSRVVFALSCP